MSAPRRLALLTPVLVYVSTIASIVSALGAQLIPEIAADLDVSLSTAQWSLTVTLLAGAVTGPILGRLGDGPYCRETLIGGLAVVTAGGVIAAVATNLPVLLVGRTMQGVGLGLVPLAMVSARDHLPRERVPSVIALLSVCAAAGLGAGYPITGILADELGLSAAFWFGALVSGGALAATVAVVPASRRAHGVRLDLRGSVLLTVGLIALLLGIAEGNTWGWGSSKILGLLGVAAVVLAGWTAQQLRCPTPLVELRLLRHPSVLACNTIALVQGVAMYINLSAVVAFVQAPSEIGYGFSASVVVAGLILVPFSITSLVASRMLPWLAHRVGERGVLPLGALTVAVAGAFFALFHGALWQAFVMMAFAGVGLGLTFAAIPGLIVRSVPSPETGSAMGFYQVIRYVGFSLGSALAATVLAGHTAAGARLPDVGGYEVALWIAVAFAVSAAVLAWVVPERGAARARRQGEATTASATDRVVAE